MIALKHLLKFVSILLLIVSSGSFGIAQNSKKAEKAFKKGVKLIEKEKYEDAVSPLYDALVEERKLEKGQDYKFVGELLELLAQFFISEEFYGAASQNYFIAALTFQHGGFTDKAQKALQQASYFEDSASKYQSKYAYSTLYADKVYTRFPIASVTDTVEAFQWFTMNLGSRDSIKVGQTGWFVTIYDPEKPDRNVISYGKTTCVEVEFGRSKWMVVPSEEGKASGFSPQVGDLNYLEVASNSNAFDGLLLELAKYDVILESDYNLPLYSYKNIQLIKKQDTEDALIGVMRDIIIGTAKSLYDPKSGTMNDKLDSGAFKGYNMWEAMLMTTTDDVKAYLRFVASFPGKYMGRGFRVDETYATWLINFTPLSNDDKTMLDTLYQNAVSDAEWKQWVDVYGKYLKSAEFDFSAVQTRIYDLISEKAYDAAEQETSRWLAVTEKFGFSTEQQGFALIRAWNLRQQKRFDESEQVYNKLLEVSPTDINLRWLRGLLYLDAENLMKAAPEFEYVKDSASYFAGGHGMYGWCLMRLGQFKKA